MPSVDDYYEPWTYDYQDLFNAPEGSDQPTARPISMITGEPMDIEAGPNWDDDLGGSPIYAANDPNLERLDPRAEATVFAVERLVFFYFPRICNHCLNPACVAACPSGALYKRGEDGIVLLDQKRCRAWRACVAACPYKKTITTGPQANRRSASSVSPAWKRARHPPASTPASDASAIWACSSTTRSSIEEVARTPDEGLIEAQRSLILDPHDPAVIAAARKNGMPESTIESARSRRSTSS